MKELEVLSIFIRFRSRVDARGCDAVRFLMLDRDEVGSSQSGVRSHPLTTGKERATGGDVDGGVVGWVEPTAELFKPLRVANRTS